MPLLLRLSSICTPLQAGARLGVKASPQAQDHVQHRQQFQRHTLLTEQRHPRTFEQSAMATVDADAALLSVDEDIFQALQVPADDPARLRQLQNASQAVQTALRDVYRVYVYGTAPPAALPRRWRAACGGRCGAASGNVRRRPGRVCNSDCPDWTRACAARSPAAIAC